MGRFLIRRCFHGLLVLWVVATFTFVLLHLTPGGPFEREKRLPPEVLANLEARYHLDKPYFHQYLRYLQGLAAGDLGPSYRYINRSVNDMILETFPVSALLGGCALAFALGLSIPLGIVAAYYQNSWLDRGCLATATLGISLPNFLSGALLLWFFALQLGWFRAGGWGDLSSLVLPTLTLGTGPAAYLTYLLRSSILDTLGEDYIRTARAKGLREPVVLLKHALRGSMIPVLTVLGPLTAGLITGSFIVEYVFAIPGMGRFFINAVTDRDYPMIMGVTLVYAVFLVLANLTVDILYRVVDPRMKAT